MSEATALSLYRKAMQAGLYAEMHGLPAHTELVNGATVTVAEEHRVRIVNTNGELGPSVLNVLAQAGVSLASSDALVR